MSVASAAPSPLDQGISWVAGGELAAVLAAYLNDPDAMSRRQIEEATRTVDASGKGISRRMLGKILSGEVAWVRTSTADLLLEAVGRGQEAQEMEFFVPA